MSDVIDINEFKKRVRDKEVDQLEEYVYSLYYEVAQGKMTLAQMNREILAYNKEHDISQEKFMELQKKLVERYGYDPDELEKQLLGAAGPLNLPQNNLLGKYGASIEEQAGYRKVIRNATNQVVIFCLGQNIVLLSENTVDLSDSELNEFLVSYKRQLGEKPLQVELAEGIRRFQY
ncbi:hypothetical protein ABB02_01231 [Clostridiaceae bacterium JG1575]|nr:hypothetical protein ABB02_01231 [Clostridiaceae bacterium JG1575]